MRSDNPDKVFVMLILMLALNVFALLPSQSSLMSGMVASNCSGVVVDIGGSADRAAVVLTSGHCVSRSKKAIQNLSLKQGMALKIHGLKGGVIARVEKVLHSSFQPLDIGIFQINKTYAELKTMGIKSYQLDSAKPNQNVKMSSGLFLQTQECRIQKLVQEIRNGSYSWKKTMKLDKKCNLTRAGFSGSPLLNEHSRVIGIVQSIQGEHTYAVDINGLADCFTQGHFTTKCQFLN